MIHNKKNIRDFGVIPGFYCNKKCLHCGNVSNSNEKLGLTRREINLVKQTVSINLFEKLIFSGGEPTFYIDSINEIVKSCPDLKKTKIQITTNGWFAKNNLDTTLSKFLKIDVLQLSYDIFHKTELLDTDIINLKNYCKENKIYFLLSTCITNPAELLKSKVIQEKLDVPIIYQKVEAFGRAKKNKIYYKYPMFQKEVFSKKCPNIGQISYICGKGFSICCSNLVFNSNQVNNDVIHQTFEKHASSEFYKQRINMTLGEIYTQKTGEIPKAVFPSSYSSECQFCEHIVNYPQKKIYKRGVIR